ncbi:MAG: hypothetical protein HZB47_11285 [Nitrosomonadales bacterium]|nr:hypothetical protein [Nitrosomonadales bacterium]
MKLPRNLTGAQLIKALEQLGYQATRQAGSHADPLRIGTLASILADVAAHHGMARDDLIQKLFGK